MALVDVDCGMAPCAAPTRSRDRCIILAVKSESNEAPPLLRRTQLNVEGLEAELGAAPVPALSVVLDSIVSTEANPLG